MKNILLALAALMSVSAAQAGSWTEPVLAQPWARQIEFPQVCEEEAVQAIYDATANEEKGASFPGPVVKPQAYEIKVRGVIYKGGNQVFEAVRIIDQSAAGSYRALVRGDFQVRGGKCKVSNVRIMKTYTQRDSE